MLFRCIALLSFVVPIVVPISGALAEPPEATRIGSFSVTPALKHQTTEVAFGVQEARKGPYVYWLRHTVSHDGQPASVQWTDTAACPAAREVLATLPALELPTPFVPGLEGPDKRDIILDGAFYSMEMRAAYGRDDASLRISSNVGTPLARWVTGALSMLEACWRQSR